VAILTNKTKWHNYNRLWKIRTFYDQLNDTSATFYSPSENFAVDGVIVIFKIKVIFRQSIPNKHKCFGINIS
jgi:hypothetical protein